MASKKQSPRQSQTASPLPTKIPTSSIILSNISFYVQEDELLYNLRQNYIGIVKVSQGYLQDIETRIDAIRIVLKSENLAKQFLEKNIICINDDEYSIETSARSLIVSNVPININEAKLSQDLGHNYLGITKISRFYDARGQPLTDIRIDFKSDSSPKKILTDNFILIDGKRRPVQPYYSLIYKPSENGTNHAREMSQKPTVEQSKQFVNKNPQNYLTERRLHELFQNHQMELHAMINQFENRWNSRLSTLTTASPNTNVDQLVPILKDLTTVCQQFSQQNAQIQRQLCSIVNRIQEVQINMNKEQVSSQTPIQNGH